MRPGIGRRWRTHICTANTGRRKSAPTHWRTMREHTRRLSPFCIKSDDVRKVVEVARRACCPRRHQSWHRIVAIEYELFMRAMPGMRGDGADGSLTAVCIVEKLRAPACLVSLDDRRVPGTRPMTGNAVLNERQGGLRSLPLTGAACADRSGFTFAMRRPISGKRATYLLRISQVRADGEVFRRATLYHQFHCHYEGTTGMRSEVH